MKMISKNLKLKALCSILLLGFLFISVSYASANDTNFQSSYTPKINDYFKYIGGTEQTETQYNSRIITNSTTSELIDYFMNTLVQKNIQDINNVSIHVDDVGQSVLLSQISVNGAENVAGSYMKNDTNAFNSNDGHWNNQSVTQNMNENPFNDSISYKFQYQPDKYPSSMIIGDTGEVYVGMNALPLGDNSNSNGCSDQSNPITIQNGGQIVLPSEYPFDDLSQFTMRGIYDTNSFNWTEFKLNNQGYINNHNAENITWSQVSLGLISGINPTYDGTTVILVYQLAQNYGTGMLEAQENICGSSEEFNPLVYFGDLSYIPLIWSNYDQDNQLFTINNNQFNLKTRTYEGSNQTSTTILTNMSLGDSNSSFYAWVTLSLDLFVKVDFVYDLNTGFMVCFSTNMKMQLGMNAEDIAVPLGDSAYYGTGTFAGSMMMENNMNFNLAQHSSLYQYIPQNSTSTSNTISTSTNTSNQVITTTDFPGYLLLFSLPITLVIRKIFYNKK